MQAFEFEVEVAVVEVANKAGMLDLNGRRDLEVGNWMRDLERSISCRIPERIV